MAAPLARALVAASQAQGDRLDFAVGKGDDADTRAVAYVMDTAKFPFFAAEPYATDAGRARLSGMKLRRFLSLSLRYHQFHDGFNLDENYPASYNRLARELAAAGGVADAGCPNGLLGVGIGGL